MKRIWCSGLSYETSEFYLEGDSFHHAVNVYRMKEGDEFETLFGEPFALTVKIVQVEKKRAKVKVLGKRSLPGLPYPRIALAVCVPRFNTFEWVLEKCVELGVESVQPLVNEYSFIKKASDIKPSRFQRWQKVIQSATEQTGRGSLMGLNSVKNLPDFIQEINQIDSDRCLFLFEGEGSVSLREALQKLSDPSEGIVSGQGGRLWALLGSEGGFSSQEVSYLNNLGFSSISLGSQILRVETACVAVASIIKYDFNQFN